MSVNMQVCVFKFENMYLCKYAIVQIYKCGNIQVCNYAKLQVSQYVSQLVCKSANMRVSKYASEQLNTVSLQLMAIGLVCLIQGLFYETSNEK